MIGRRSFLSGLVKSLIAAPAILALPLEMPVRGVPLVTDQDIVAELMRRLDTNDHVLPDEWAPFYRAPLGGSYRFQECPGFSFYDANSQWFDKPNFERVS